MRLKKEEKAHLYDELRKRAVYEPPDYGYHNGRWVVIITVDGDNDCPSNFTTALKRSIRDEHQQDT